VREKCHKTYPYAPVSFPVPKSRTYRPKYVNFERTRHGATVCYYREGNGPRTRLDGEFGSPAFWASYAAAAGGLSETDERFKNKRLSRIATSIRSALAAAKHRAGKRGLPFDLTQKWALDKIERQEFKCALTGIQFLLEEQRGTTHARPYTPSFDRIDCSGGYTMDNVRIVVFAVNMMLSDWGEDVFHRVADGYRQVQKAGA
jgi:hypothetical protein